MENVSSSSNRTRICALLCSAAVLACARRYSSHSEPSCPPPLAETRIGYDRAMAGAIRGMVLDRDSGRALSEARVELMPAGQIGTTDSTGHFAFSDVREGTYQLSVRRLGYERRVVTLAVRRGEGIRAQFALTPASVDRCFEIVEVRTPLPWWHFW